MALHGTGPVASRQATALCDVIARLIVTELGIFQESVHHILIQHAFPCIYIYREGYRDVMAWTSIDRQASGWLRLRHWRMSHA
jgi:hypothetical protein